MQTRGAAFQLGHLIARSSPTRQPRHAAQPPFPHLQLYDILPWPCRSTSSCSALNLFLVSCFSCYLSPHYKDTLYISLKGFPYSLICFLAFSIKADCCIQDSFYLEPSFFFFAQYSQPHILFVCFFHLHPQPVYSKFDHLPQISAFFLLSPLFLTLISPSLYFFS